MTIRRKSSLAAAKRIQVQVTSDLDDAPKRVVKTAKAVRKSSTRVEVDASWTADAPPSEEEAEAEAPRPAKRQKTNASARSGLSQLNSRLFGTGITASWKACRPPARRHAVDYHRPLLLSGEQGRAGRDALLGWFDGVSAARAMPWRKAWIDPRSYGDGDGAADELRRALERRAYEVWISEIMLQQTRVAVVIDYWKRWMARWPTIQDLARADGEDVLSAWRGLGYYSRATRIHAAAQKVVSDGRMRGLLPETAEELEANVPGVGRYTGGAISAIVFGHAAPMVDGNVLRVLSRQLGILGSVKTDKTVISTLWAAADALVKAVADDASEDAETPQRSDAPGRWGQGLMELGSTVCTPKPNCSACPVTSTCRAYGEGLLMTVKSQKPSVGDIEELCNLCEPMEEVEVPTEDEDGDDFEVSAKADVKKKPQGKKQATLSSFFGQPASAAKKPKSTETGISGKALEVAIEHARKFPVKVVKKAVREEETIVCAIKRSDGSYLIQRRPDKGWSNMVVPR